MSAVAPISKPDDEPESPGSSGMAGPAGASPPPSSETDGWALLEGLRRRLDDQGATSRKTQNQVTQLAESIASLVEHQRQRTRRVNLNSFIAYLIFTILVGSGFYGLYRSRANELVEARDHAISERDTSRRRGEEAVAKSTARDLADAKAWEVYQLLEAGQRTEAKDKLAALRDLPLSRTERAILAATAHSQQVIEVDAALKAAVASFKAGRYADMIAPLETALVGEPAGARAATMHYYLGIAYAKSGDLDKAISHLQAAVTAEVDQDDARFQLASALDRGGQFPRARGEYDRFATAHPQSQLAVFAMRRSATLARMPAQPVQGAGSAAPPKPIVAPPAKAGSAAAPPITPPVAPATPVAPKPAGVAPKPAGVAPKPAGVAPPTAVPTVPPPVTPPPSGSAISPNPGE